MVSKKKDTVIGLKRKITRLNRDIDGLVDKIRSEEKRLPSGKISQLRDAGLGYYGDLKEKSEERSKLLDKLKVLMDKDVV